MVKLSWNNNNNYMYYSLLERTKWFIGYLWIFPSYFTTTTSVTPSDVGWRFGDESSVCSWIMHCEIQRRCRWSSVCHFTVKQRATMAHVKDSYLVLGMSSLVGLDWPTIVFQCSDTVGWVIWPVKSSQIWPIMCLWDVKPY